MNVAAAGFALAEAKHKLRVAVIARQRIATRKYRVVSSSIPAYGSHRKGPVTAYQLLHARRDVEKLGGKEIEHTCTRAVEGERVRETRN